MSIVHCPMSNFPLTLYLSIAAPTAPYVPATNALCKVAEMIERDRPQELIDLENQARQMGLRLAASTDDEAINLLTQCIGQNFPQGLRNWSQVISLLLFLYKIIRLVSLPLLSRLPSSNFSFSLLTEFTFARLFAIFLAFSSSTLLSSNVRKHSLPQTLTLYFQSILLIFEINNSGNFYKGRSHV